MNDGSDAFETHGLILNVRCGRRSSQRRDTGGIVRSPSPMPQ